MILIDFSWKKWMNAKTSTVHAIDVIVNWSFSTESDQVCRWKVSGIDHGKVHSECTLVTCPTGTASPSNTETFLQVIKQVVHWTDRMLTYTTFSPCLWTWLAENVYFYWKRYNSSNRCRLVKSKHLARRLQEASIIQTPIVRSLTEYVAMLDSRLLIWCTGAWAPLSGGATETSVV